jgi:L-2-amino-thiazoline-4-carboxylic acid hydrolase
MWPLSFVEVLGPNVKWGARALRTHAHWQAVTVFDLAGSSSQPECTACPFDSPGLVLAWKCGRSADLKYSSLIREGAMKTSDLKTTLSAVRGSLGPSWPLFLVSSAIYSNTVFKNTHWASTPGEEAKFVKRMALAPATYLKLSEKLGKEEAYEVMEQILVPVGVDDMQSFVGSVPGMTAMERLLAFNEAYDSEGATQFMEKEVLRQDDSTCHFVIKRCVAWEFLQEAGTPELTRLFCESDHVFFPNAFPEFEFTRGDSRDNTLAYGNNQCEYLFKKKA